MAIYEPRQGEYGHMAKLTRVNALRGLEQAGVISYESYLPTTPPQFMLTNVQGTERRPTGREVPVYVLGAADLMLAVQADVLDMVNTAYARPDVVDRESLAEAIQDELDRRYGAALRAAADAFAVQDAPAMAAAS
jgi:hypothetical protein